MTVYVSDCSPWRYLWADTPDEALVMIYAVGSDYTASMESVTGWDHYAVGAEEYALAIFLGAEETDRFGPAEWLAVRRGDHDMVASIRRTRGVQLQRT